MDTKNKSKEEKDELIKEIEGKKIGKMNIFLISQTY